MNATLQTHLAQAEGRVEMEIWSLIREAAGGCEELVRNGHLPDGEPDIEEKVFDDDWANLADWRVAVGVGCICYLYEYKGDFQKNLTDLNNTFIYQSMESPSARKLAIWEMALIADALGRLIERLEE